MARTRLGLGRSRWCVVQSALCPLSLSLSSSYALYATRPNYCDLTMHRTVVCFLCVTIDVRRHPDLQTIDIMGNEMKQIFPANVTASEGAVAGWPLPSVVYSIGFQLTSGPSHLLI